MEDSKILSPKNDYLFKKLFYDEKDTNILKKLLVDCMEYDIEKLENIQLIDRSEDRLHENDKLVVFDINAKLKDGSLINIEMQMWNEKGFKERAIFYASRRLSSQGEKGMKYEDLKQTVSLNILDFNIFHQFEDFYSKFFFMEEKHGLMLSDLLRIDFLELKKFNRDKAMGNNKKELWLRFFNAKSKEELDMLKDIDKTFEKPVEKLMYLSSDPRILSEYDLRERQRMDEIARLDFARDEGIEKGIEKGIKKGRDEEKINIAKNFINLNMDNETISQGTGLSVEEIKKIRKEIEES